MNSGFNLYLPPDASPARRQAHAAYKAAAEAAWNAKTADDYNQATELLIKAKADYGRVLLAEDKKRRPHIYAKSPPAMILPTSVSDLISKLEQLRDQQGPDARVLVRHPALTHLCQPSARAANYTYTDEHKYHEVTDPALSSSACVIIDIA